MPENIPADVTMLLFAYKQPGDNPVPWPAYPGARIYYFRYYDKDGAPIRNVVPARRDSDGELCFYDFVSETAIVKMYSTGMFKAGPAIKVANGDVSLAADAFVDDLYVKDGAPLDLAGTTLSVAGNIYSVDESVYEAAVSGF